MSNQSVSNWKAIVRALRYLRYAQDCCLHWIIYLAMLEEYSDANYVFNIKDLKFTSGYVLTLVGVTLLWKSSKQTMIH